MNGLTVNFLGKNINPPLLLPSGILGMSYSSLKRVVNEGAGIVTTKSLSLKPRTGHKGPIFCEFPGGIINSVGLSNPGIKPGLAEVAQFKAESESPVITNIFGADVNEFVELAKYADDSPTDFLELNLSCPNVADEFGRPFAYSAELVGEITSKVKAVTKIPLIAKLSPNVYNITEIALAAENAGADALCLINTLGHGMLIDIDAEGIVFPTKWGGISGPAIKPLAIKLIYQTYSSVKIPIIGMGGVMNHRDAIEMMMAGATLVGIGSGVYYRGVNIFSEISAGMTDWLSEKKYSGLQEIIGLIHNNQGESK